MAAELDHRCPICLDSVTDASFVMPCKHWFCFRCIRRCVRRRRKCPLCRGRVMFILHFVEADISYEELVLRQRRRARRRQRRQMRSRAAPFLQPPSVFQPVLPWLRQELRQLFGADHGAASAVQRLLSSGLSFFGLDEAALTARLISSLQSQAARFTRWLAVRAAQLCGREQQHQPAQDASHASTGQESSPAAAHRAEASPAHLPEPQPSSSTWEGNVEEELPGPSTCAICEGPSQPPSNPAPVDVAQEAAQEEPGEAVPGPSSASTGRERSLRAPRRAPKRRRTHTSEDSAPPAKRPPRRRR